MNDLPREVKREVKRILISTSNRLIGTQSSHWVHLTQTVALVLNDTISDYKDDFQQTTPVRKTTQNQQSMTR